MNEITTFASSIVSWPGAFAVAAIAAAIAYAVGKFFDYLKSLYE